MDPFQDADASLMSVDSTDNSASTLPTTEAFSPIRRSVSPSPTRSFKRFRTAGPSAPSSIPSSYLFRRNSTSPAILPPGRPKFGAVTDGRLRRSQRASLMATSDASGIHSRLRQFTLPPKLSNSSFDGDETPLDWRKTCRKLLRELKRKPRSVYFREPVDIRQYPVSFRLCSPPTRALLLFSFSGVCFNHVAFIIKQLFFSLIASTDTRVSLNLILFDSADIPGGCV